MLDKLKAIEKEYEELTKVLSDPATANDKQKYQASMKRLSSLSILVEKASVYRKLVCDLQGGVEMSKGADAELAEMARTEVKELELKRIEMEKEIKYLLIPKDPNDEKNTIVEIRAGTGGDEAALFAAELFRIAPRRPPEKE